MAHGAFHHGAISTAGSWWYLLFLENSRKQHPVKQQRRGRSRPVSEVGSSRWFALANDLRPALETQQETEPRPKNSVARPFCDLHASLQQLLQALRIEKVLKEAEKSALCSGARRAPSRLRLEPRPRSTPASSRPRSERYLRFQSPCSDKKWRPKRRPSGICGPP